MVTKQHRNAAGRFTKHAGAAKVEIVVSLREGAEVVTDPRGAATNNANNAGRGEIVFRCRGRRLDLSADFQDFKILPLGEVVSWILCQAQGEAETRQHRAGGGGCR